jgi:hypothetical protein
MPRSIREVGLIISLLNADYNPRWFVSIRVEPPFSASKDFRKEKGGRVIFTQPTKPKYESVPSLVGCGLKNTKRFHTSWLSWLGRKREK